MSGKLKKKIEKPPFDYKTTIWVGLAVVALLLVIMAILKFNQNEKIDSSYFHDADGKIVLTMDEDVAELDNSEWEPPITHIVYYHDGDKITSVRAFYEYKTEADAEEANKHLELGDFADGKKMSGRFIVFDVKKSQYDGMTVTELEENRELLKQIDALILDYDS